MLLANLKCVAYPIFCWPITGLPSQKFLEPPLLTAQKKSPKMVIFGKFSPKGYIPLSDFFTKFCLWERAAGPHQHAKFHRCSFKNVAVRLQKSPKMVILGKNLPPLKNYGGR